MCDNFLIDEALLSMSRAGCGQLVKCSVTKWLLRSNFAYLFFEIVQPQVFKTVLLYGLQVCTLSVKMLITLEPHSIFGPNLAYICMSTLSNHWKMNMTSKCSDQSAHLEMFLFP